MGMMLIPGISSQPMHGWSEFNPHQLATRVLSHKSISKVDITINKNVLCPSATKYITYWPQPYYIHSLTTGSSQHFDQYDLDGINQILFISVSSHCSSQLLFSKFTPCLSLVLTVQDLTQYTQHTHMYHRNRLSKHHSHINF